MLGAFNPLAGFSAPSPNLSLAARVLLLHRASPPPPTTSLTTLVRRPVVVVPRHPLDTALVVVILILVILVVVLVVVVDATRADIIAVFALRCRSRDRRGVPPFETKTMLTMTMMNEKKNESLRRRADADMTLPSWCFYESRTADLGFNIQ